MQWSRRLRPSLERDADQERRGAVHERRAVERIGVAEDPFRTETNADVEAPAATKQPVAEVRANGERSLDRLLRFDRDDLEWNAERIDGEDVRSIRGNRLGSRWRRALAACGRHLRGRLTEPAASRVVRTAVNATP